MDFIHLNIKSHYSLMQSLLTVDDLVNLSKKNEFSAVALCDINSTFGLNELYYKSNDLKPLLGVELEFLNDSYILYAKNYQGLQNIYYLTTLVNRGELTYDIFFENVSDVVCILNENSKVYSQFLKHQDVRNYFEKVSTFFENIYFISTYEEVSVIEFCKIFKIKKLYGYATVYEKYSDKKYYNLLNSIKKGENYIRTNEGSNCYFYSKDEILELVNDEIIFNTSELISLCNVVIPTDKKVPIFDESVNSGEYLLALCKKGLSKRINSINDIYIERLKYELSVINKMGFADYFLIVYDYVKYAKTHNIMVGAGRGSAAGSLVAYVLGITDIDPIKYNLLFERFLNPERISWPDIDVDFEDTRRDEVVKYVANKYGYEHVGAIATFSTFASRQVMRDCAKAFGKNSVDIKYLTEHIIPTNSLKQNYSENIKFRNIIESNAENERIYQYALRLEGLVRHISVHAAGIVVSSSKLEKTIGCIEGYDVATIASSMDNLEKMGLIKMDFLGLRNLTLLKSVVNLIKNNTSTYINLNEIDLNEIDLNDSKVLQLFCDARTLGIFQFESEGMKKLLRSLKPKKFLDLAAANALHRPGPMDNIDEFVARAHGKKFEYIHPDLEEILNDTYGIIVYQEQIMQIARHVAGFSYAKADIMRSAMSKKNESKLLMLKEDFIKSSVSNGYDFEIVEEIYNLILKFANYGFNKAHAVSYSYIGYLLAYLKTYYFKYFMCELLNNVTTNSNKVFEYINECRLNNVEIVGVDVNLSESKFCIKDEKIILPFTLVKGINTSQSEQIIEERNCSNFTNFHDFVTRVAKNDIKSSMIENLVYCNAFETIDNHSKSVQIQAINGIIDMVSV
ncbi:MAG: DNA polymerase III subunit alpha, partial [Bacilli bacterium]